MLKFIPKTTDTIVLTLVTLLTIGVFTAGLCDVLDYIIVKVVLVISFGTLFFMACYYAIKNDVIENRLEETPQDDLN